MRMERMPLTANGKLDRRSLPAAEGNAYVSRAYEEPQGETEILLAGLLAKLLHLERVGRHDNFFELGGHSLLAIRLIGQLRQRLGIELPLRALFESPTLAGIAERTDLEVIGLKEERTLEQESLEQEMRAAISGLSYEELRAFIAVKKRILN
jgi:acyl carrier protein